MCTCVRDKVLERYLFVVFAVTGINNCNFTKHNCATKLNWPDLPFENNMYIYIYICIYIHVYTYVCIYVCVSIHIHTQRESLRERERPRERERE